MMRILHVAAEAFPLIKTGGLADVAAALPATQRALGADPLLLMPGYPAVLEALAAAGPLQPQGESSGPSSVRHESPCDAAGCPAAICR